MELYDNLSLSMDRASYRYFLRIKLIDWRAALRRGAGCRQSATAVLPAPYMLLWLEQIPLSPAPDMQVTAAWR